MTGRSSTGFSLIIVFMLALTGCEKADPLTQPGVITLSSAFSAEFSLTDQFGMPASDERFEGKPMLLYFGFASCPDVCPAALSVMSAALEVLGKDADKVQALFITIDPERDSAATLKSHLAFDPRILGLTGTLEQTEAARKAMKVYAQKVPLPDSALVYTMDHQSMFYIVDSDGVPQIALRDTVSPDLIKQVIREFVN